MAAYNLKKRLTFQSEDLSPMEAGPGTHKKQRKMNLDLSTGKFLSVQADFSQFLYRWH